MQSIYRFRQADVNLFLQARTQGIGALRLEPLTLSVNFRSRPEVVRWVNDTFAGILPAKDDLESGAVSYCPSIAAEGGELQGRIDVHAFSNELDEEAGVLELVKNSGDKKIAVLVRARSHLGAVVSILNHNRIPFQAIEIDHLSERAVIEDLMALTLALLHPGDRVSCLAILRAPWCGLTLQDLHALAGQDHHSAVWDLLRQTNSPLSDDCKARIKRILPLLQAAIPERARQPLRACVYKLFL